MNDADYVNTFRQYIGLKLHFDMNNTYEFRGTDGLTKLNEAQMLSRKDCHYFVELTKRHKNPRRMQEFFISMFLHDRHMWVGDMCDVSKDIIHTKRVGNLLKLDYLIKSQVDDLMMFNDDDLTLEDMLLTDGDRPYIIRSQRCCDEVLAAINKVYNFTDVDSINPYWNERKYSINMYSKLLQVSDKSILFLKSLLEENNHESTCINI